MRATDHVHATISGTPVYSECCPRAVLFVLRSFLPPPPFTIRVLPRRRRHPPLAASWLMCASGNTDTHPGGATGAPPLSPRVPARRAHALPLASSRGAQSVRHRGIHDQSPILPSMRSALQLHLINGMEDVLERHGVVRGGGGALLVRSGSILVRVRCAG